MKKSICLSAAIASALGVFVLAGLNTKLLTRRYRVSHPMIKSTVKLVYISDLHNNDYSCGLLPRAPHTALLLPQDR